MKPSGFAPGTLRPSPELALRGHRNSAAPATPHGTADLAERKHSDDYQVAYEEALGATSTKWAPFYVVPADHKYALRALVGGVNVEAIDEMRPGPPVVADDKLNALATAKGEFLAEP